MTTSCSELATTISAMLSDLVRSNASEERIRMKLKRVYDQCAGEDCSDSEFASYEPGFESASECSSPQSSVSHEPKSGPAVSTSASSPESYANQKKKEGKTKNKGEDTVKNVPKKRWTREQFFDCLLEHVIEPMLIEPASVGNVPEGIAAFLVAHAPPEHREKILVQTQDYSHNVRKGVGDRLAERLKDKSTDVRSAAIKALASYQRDDPDILADICRLAKADQSKAVRQVAIQLLEVCEASFPTLVSKMLDKEEECRNWALKGLAQAPLEEIPSEFLVKIICVGTKSKHYDKGASKELFLDLCSTWIKNSGISVFLSLIDLTKHAESVRNLLSTLFGSKKLTFNDCFLNDEQMMDVTEQLDSTTNGGETELKEKDLSNDSEESEMDLEVAYKTKKDNRKEQVVDADEDAATITLAIDEHSRVYCRFTAKHREDSFFWNFYLPKASEQHEHLPDVPTLVLFLAQTDDNFIVEMLMGIAYGILLTGHTGAEILAKACKGLLKSRNDLSIEVTKGAWEILRLAIDALFPRINDSCAAFNTTAGKILTSLTNFSSKTFRDMSDNEAKKRVLVVMAPLFEIQVHTQNRAVHILSHENRKKIIHFALKHAPEVAAKYSCIAHYVRTYTSLDPNVSSKEDREKRNRKGYKYVPYLFSWLQETATDVNLAFLRVYCAYAFLTPLKDMFDFLVAVEPTAPSGLPDSVSIPQFVQNYGGASIGAYATKHPFVSLIAEKMLLKYTDKPNHLHVIVVGTGKILPQRPVGKVWRKLLSLYFREYNNWEIAPTIAALNYYFYCAPIPDLKKAILHEIYFAKNDEDFFAHPEHERFLTWFIEHTWPTPAMATESEPQNIHNCLALFMLIDLLTGVESSRTALVKCLQKLCLDPEDRKGCVLAQRLLHELIKSLQTTGQNDVLRYATMFDPFATALPTTPTKDKSTQSLTRQFSRSSSKLTPSKKTTPPKLGRNTSNSQPDAQEEVKLPWISRQKLMFEIESYFRENGLWDAFGLREALSLVFNTEISTDETSELSKDSKKSRRNTKLLERRGVKERTDRREGETPRIFKLVDDEDEIVNKEASVQENSSEEKENEEDSEGISTGEEEGEVGEELGLGWRMKKIKRPYQARTRGRKRRTLEEGESEEGEASRSRSQSRPSRRNESESDADEDENQEEQVEKERGKRPLTTRGRDQGATQRRGRGTRRVEKPSANSSSHSRTESYSRGRDNRADEVIVLDSSDEEESSSHETPTVGIKMTRPPPKPETKTKKTFRTENTTTPIPTADTTTTSNSRQLATKMTVSTTRPKRVETAVSLISTPRKTTTVTSPVIDLTLDEGKEHNSGANSKIIAKEKKVSSKLSLRLSPDKIYEKERKEEQEKIRNGRKTKAKEVNEQKGKDEKGAEERELKNRAKENERKAKEEKEGKELEEKEKRLKEEKEQKAAELELQKKRKEKKSKEKNERKGLEEKRRKEDKEKQRKKEKEEAERKPREQEKDKEKKEQKEKATKEGRKRTKRSTIAKERKEKAVREEKLREAERRNPKEQEKRKVEDQQKKRKEKESSSRLSHEYEAAEKQRETKKRKKNDSPSSSFHEPVLQTLELEEEIGGRQGTDGGPTPTTAYSPSPSFISTAPGKGRLPKEKHSAKTTEKDKRANNREEDKKAKERRFQLTIDDSSREEEDKPEETQKVRELKESSPSLGLQSLTDHHFSVVPTEKAKGKASVWYRDLKDNSEAEEEGQEDGEREESEERSTDNVPQEEEEYSTSDDSIIEILLPSLSSLSQKHRRESFSLFESDSDSRAKKRKRSSSIQEEQREQNSQDEYTPAKRNLKSMMANITTTRRTSRITRGRDLLTPSMEINEEHEQDTENEKGDIVSVSGPTLRLKPDVVAYPSKSRKNSNSAKLLKDRK